MFKKIAASATYDWPVEVAVPEDGGIWSRHKFTAQFARFTKDQAKALVDKLGEEKDNGEPFEALDLVAQVMAGWKDVTDADGQPLPYSETELRSVCNLFPMAIGAIFDAWMESLSKGKEKNFKRPRATG